MSAIDIKTGEHLKSFTAWGMTLQERLEGIWDLDGFLGRQPTSREIPLAHANLNKLVGIYGTNDGTPLTTLERKLELASTTGVHSWLV